MKPKRRRTMTIKCNFVKARKSWANSALIIEDCPVGRSQQRVTVLITRPGDIAYLRERLQEIEDGWRAQLEGIKVTP